MFWLWCRIRIFLNRFRWLSYRRERQIRDAVIAEINRSLAND